MYRYFFFFKQKTAYELRISDWSSDVCSSDLRQVGQHEDALVDEDGDDVFDDADELEVGGLQFGADFGAAPAVVARAAQVGQQFRIVEGDLLAGALRFALLNLTDRSEEHTSELQSIMRISYAVFCLNKKL